jgi:hypothetical protein
LRPKTPAADDGPAFPVTSGSTDQSGGLGKQPRYQHVPQLEGYALVKQSIPICEASFGVEQLFDKANEFVVVLSKGGAAAR